jgi:mannose-6-phosphate isomerase-like protein (cupin superfamily)
MGNDRRLVGPRGVQIRFLRTAAETEGALVELETVLPPRTNGPPLHIHLRERESFRVTEGELAIRAGRHWRLYGVGEAAAVEPGTPHTFANKSDAPATFVVRIEPPDPFESMIRIGLASRMMPVLRLAEVHHGEDATLMLARAPVFAQRMVWNGLAGIARIVHR